MSSVLIKEIGRVITGNTPSKSNEVFYESDDIGFIKPDIISEDKITYIKSPKEFISEQARSKARIVCNKAVLVTCIGSIGKIGIIDSGEYAFNQQINAIEPNEKVSSEYLAYCLLYNRDRLVHIANAPVVPIINKTQFENFRINIVDEREKQNQIVERLNKVSKAINMCKQQIEKYDLLIKSRFMELFGDPVQNPKKWREVNISEVLNGKVSNGFFAKRDDYTDEGNVSVIQMVTTTNYYRNQILTQSKTATMTTIGQDGLLKTNILLPPIEFQNQFAALVQQVDKLKSTTQKSIEKLQTLFDSLLQKYFG